MHALNIFKQPDATRRPWFFGRLPSRSGGMLSDVSFGFTPDGEAKVTSVTQGRVSDSSEPFFYLYIAGGTLEMNQSDMHECIEEMQAARRKKWEERQPPASSQELKNKVGDLIEAVKDAQVARRRF